MRKYWAIKVEWKEGGSDWAWYSDNINHPSFGNRVVGDYRKDVLKIAIKWRGLANIKSARPVKIRIMEGK